MSLWADKYRPKDLSKLDIHKKQADDLKNLIKQGDFPHLLVYGPLGAGKKTLIMCLLKELYGSGVERLRMEQLNFTTPSNKKLEIGIVSSNYHIEVNPSDVGIYDRVVIMDLIKNVAQTHQLGVSGQREFKVVVLNNVDNLTKDAQHALRRTMEKYIATCRLILCANSISRVTPAIRSRCLGVRVPAPTHEEITSVLLNVCKGMKLVLDPEFGQKVAVASNRNLRRALLTLEACKASKDGFNLNQELPKPDYDNCIRAVAKKILYQQSVSNLMTIRGNLYELIVHGIPSDLIFKILLEELLVNCDIELKSQVVEMAAKYEHRMQQGRKEIFHFEAFICNFMAIYKKFMEESIGIM